MSISILKELILNEEGKIIPQRATKKYLEKKGLLDFLDNSFNDSYSLSEKIYCFVHDIGNRKTCKTCKKEILFNHGYATFCSNKCINLDQDVLNKNKIGVSKSLKNAYENRGKDIKEKRSNSLNKRYGKKVNTPFLIKEVRENIKKTLLNKYGVENVFHLKKYRSDGKESMQKISILLNKDNGYDVKYLDADKLEIKNLCEIHGSVTMNSVNFYNRVYRNRGGIKCAICNPINSFSSLEIEFENIIKEIGISNYIRNTKKIITPLELDFYFPDEKIAVELNGIYWHSEFFKDKFYHQKKFNLCKEKGIQLIQIWEDDFYENKGLIKSIMMSKFNRGLKRIYARKCKINLLSSQEYRDFLEPNHIQGKMNSSIRYGLFYDDDLVSVMGFGKLRVSLGSKSKKDDWELHRFCSKKEHLILGGASKLFAQFIRKNKFNNIISYAKMDYSTGGIYEKLNFKLEKICDPGYYWIVNGKRKHRYNYRKNKIMDESNRHLSAIEIMKQKGFFRCFDSGNLKYIYSKRN